MYLRRDEKVGTMSSWEDSGIKSYMYDIGCFVGPSSGSLICHSTQSEIGPRREKQHASGLGQADRLAFISEIPDETDRMNRGEQGETDGRFILDRRGTREQQQKEEKKYAGEDEGGSGTNPRQR